MFCRCRSALSYLIRDGGLTRKRSTSISSLNLWREFITLKHAITHTFGVPLNGQCVLFHLGAQKAERKETVEISS